MEFSKKLKKLRAEKGISQQKLADMLFVSRSAVAKWENGLGLPSEGSYEALAGIFGVSQESLTTDEPERIVIEKNKKIQKLFGSAFAAMAIVIIVMITYVLFRPMPYYASASWDRIEIQMISEDAESVEITEKDKVEECIDWLNSVNVRKSFRLSNEAPDGLRAIFHIRGNNGTGNDIWLCSTDRGRFSVYIWTGTEELVVSDPENLGGYMVQLIAKSTAL